MGSSTVRIAVYEGRETEEELSQLRTILATPDLQAPRSQLLPSGGLMKEGEIAALTVPDHQKIRTTLFWRYVPEGLMGAKIYEESGMKQLGPLTQWVKSDIESRRLCADPGTRVMEGTDFCDGALT